MLQNFIKPHFIKNKILPFEGCFKYTGFLLFFIGYYAAIFIAPNDYQQGVIYKIMYVHVPSAWMALMVYSIMAFSSLIFLIYKSPIANKIAKISCPIGMGYNFVALVTGSLWGKPMWGTWWVWDARLTSMLILFFFYLSYFLLIKSYDHSNNESKGPASLAVLGFVNVPIVKFSVDLWATLHQPASVFRFSKPAIDFSMLWPLLLCFLACVVMYIYLVVAELKIYTKNK